MKLRLVFNFKTNFSIFRTLDISNFFLGLFEVRNIDSQLYQYHSAKYSIAMVLPDFI